MKESIKNGTALGIEDGFLEEQAITYQLSYDDMSFLCFQTSFISTKIFPPYFQTKHFKSFFFDASGQKGKLKLLYFFDGKSLYIFQLQR